MEYKSWDGIQILDGIKIRMISFFQPEDPGMDDGQVVGNHVQESRKVRKSFHPSSLQHNLTKCENTSIFNMEHRVTHNFTIL